MRSREEIISNLNDCKEYSGDFHDGFESALLWVLDENNEDKSPQNLPKADAYSLLADVRELGESISDIYRFMPDESSVLGEKYKAIVDKYNKLSEHFS